MGGSLGENMFWKVYAWDLRLHQPTKHAPCPEAKEECGVRAIRRARELGRFRVDTGKGPKISVWHKPKQQRNVFFETVGHLLVYIFWYTGSAQQLSTSKAPHELPQCVGKNTLCTASPSHRPRVSPLILSCLQLWPMECRNWAPCRAWKPRRMGSPSGNQTWLAHPPFCWMIFLGVTEGPLQNNSVQDRGWTCLISFCFSFTDLPVG